MRIIRGVKALSSYFNEIGVEISETTIYRLIKNNEIPFSRPSKGILLFNLNAIDEWLLDNNDQAL